MMTVHNINRAVALIVVCAWMIGNAWAAPGVRIMPPNRATWLIDQRFDLRVEASGFSGTLNEASFQITINGQEINRLFPGKATFDAASRSVTLRQISFSTPMRNAEIKATVTAGQESATASVRFDVVDFRGKNRPVRNVIIMIGDGMGLAHRTAARILAKGVTEGKANGLLNMDTMPVTGLVMTSSLDALVTDSAPGADSYSTGNKANNNQVGVFPDNTPHAFDNPRKEHLAEYLRRYDVKRGGGKSLGLVTTSDVADATPAGFAVHTSDRGAGSGICDMFFDERSRSGLTVLMGGGRQWFLPAGTSGSARSASTDHPDHSDPTRHLLQEFIADGWTYVQDKDELTAHASQATKLLGLFHLGNMNVAFDKLRLGDPNVVADFPRQPMLDEMTRAAIQVLNKNKQGFVLMVEGASIDKQAHQMDSERWLWDVIEFDRAVGVALEFARQDGRTLVIVTADHETGGVTLNGVGNPALREQLGIHPDAASDYPQAYRDYPNYTDANGDGYPDHPDPTKKLIIGYGAGVSRTEDYLSNPRPVAPTRVKDGVVQPNPERDPNGTFISGQIENGASKHPTVRRQSVAVHTACDVPLSAFGPGAHLFTGVQDNTDVFFKIMSVVGGKY